MPLFPDSDHVLTLGGANFLLPVCLDQSAPVMGINVINILKNGILGVSIMQLIFFFSLPVLSQRTHLI